MLAHYGVKGMKWGVRKARRDDDASPTTGGRAKEPEEDPRQTSDIPDDGRSLSPSQFKYLWRDSKNYVRVGEAKIKKDKEGMAYAEYGGKVYKSSNPRALALKINKMAAKDKKNRDDADRKNGVKRMTK